MNKSKTTRMTVFRVGLLLIILCFTACVGCSVNEQSTTPTSNQEDNKAGNNQKTVEIKDETEPDQPKSNDESASTTEPVKVAKERSANEAYLVDDFFAAIVIRPIVILNEYKSADEHLKQMIGISELNPHQLDSVAMFVSPVPESVFSPQIVATNATDSGEENDKEAVLAETPIEPPNESEPPQENPESEEPDEPSPDFEGLFEGLQPEPEVDPDDRARDWEPELNEAIAWRVPSYVSKVLRFLQKDHARSFVTDLVIAHHFIVADHNGTVYYKQIGPDEFSATEDDPEKEKAELESPTVLAAIYLSDDGTVIIAPEFYLKKMIASEKPAGVLIGQLSGDFNEADIFAVAIPDAAIKTVRNALELCNERSETDILGPIENMTTDLSDLKPTTLSLKIDIQSDEPLTLKLATNEKQELQKLLPLIEALPSLFQSVAPGLAKDASPTSAFLIESLLGLIEDSRIQSTDSEISFTGHANSARRDEILAKSMKAADLARRLFDLSRIGRAMVVFQDVNGELPDNSPVDESEHSTSWRVKLLPYLDEALLYGEYRTDEPWNSDHNIELLENMPAIFGDGIETSILRITGKNTVFAEDKPMKLSEIKDDSSLTLFAIRANEEQAVPWTKPVDLEFDEEQPFRSLGVDSETVIEAIFLDGHASDISKETDSDKLRSLVNPQDRKPVPADDHSVEK